ncbi:sulfotransferase 2B1-like isoform X3 [Anguilla anguilla]|uniref:sulfotransferase 2B1-like isoform X3 n=1 Tax=Anguilla anguilla TaxID=7936 RepID=UPI0015B2C4AE|nr:sulfotransferase 2B1-like isoform X3 [Anguilla anguilla]
MRMSLQSLIQSLVHDDDVFAVTYPKSGTTWMQEILPPILNGGDLTPVQTIPNWDRVPWLEETRAALVLGDRPPPRAMVSHLPYHLMPPSFYTSKAKVIYVTRNPKDIAVSSFHFHKMASFLDDPGTFDEFLDKFLSGQVLFGKWTDHVKSWRNTDIEDRILYVTYEEMVQSLTTNLTTFEGTLESFLGKQSPALHGGSAVFPALAVILQLFWQWLVSDCRVQPIVHQGAQHFLMQISRR